MKWTLENVNKIISLVDSGFNFKQIADIIGLSQSAVTKKLHRLGYKSPYVSGLNKGETKYANYDWDKIQKNYNDGHSLNDLEKNFNISSRALCWAVKNNLLKTRTQSEGLSLAWKNGKYEKSNAIGLARYRQLCEFKFNLNDYPDKFDFTLIEQYGWYKAKNRGNNLGGVSRDHMYSIKDGYINNIDPKIISHPANCNLIRHPENSKKRSNSSITLEELFKRINEWDR
jgi:Mor family transcriptional regulator